MVAAAKLGAGNLKAHLTEYDAHAQRLLEALEEAARGGAAEAFRVGLGRCERYDHLEREVQDAVEEFQARQTRAAAQAKLAGESGTAEEAGAALATCRSLDVDTPAVEAAERALGARQ